MHGPRRGVAQSGSALGWGPSGRRFKSCLPDYEELAWEAGSDCFGLVGQPYASPRGTASSTGSFNQDCVRCVFGVE
jgi:hypothetical protein